MVERIRHLLARFPENEALVSDLIGKDPAFNALCQEYHALEGEIEGLRLATDPERMAYAEGLRQRWRSVEEDILTRIEGYRPD
jgi:uncharacterized protein YdcH (DUF465 family)